MSSNIWLTDRWYIVPKHQIPDALERDFRNIAASDRVRQDSLLYHKSLYRDRRFHSVTPWGYRDYEGGSMSENMLRPIVDTLTAKLIRHRPRVTAATIGGSRESKKRARKLSLFWDGVWQEAKVYENQGKYVREGVVLGDGIRHPRKEIDSKGKGKICIDIVGAEELFVDQVESFYGNPQNMYRRRYVDRALLKAKFPEHSKAIEEAQTFVPDTPKAHQPMTDLVELLEGWHLASEDGKDDGRYVMVLGDVLLKEAPWKYTKFPFVRFSPTPPMASDGYWGVGVVEAMSKAQMQLTGVADLVNESQRLLGHPMILSPKNGEINPKHLKNITGVVIEYKGTTPPTIYTPDPISQQTYMDVENRRRKMQEDSGVSRMSITSTKPQGFDPSGRAIQEMSDVETERFMEMGRALEASMVELSEWTVALAKELDEELEGGYKVISCDGRDAIEIKWKDVCMAQDAYITKVEATSWQGRSIPGRIADVERLANAGVITDEAVFARMLQIPDIDSYLDEHASPRDVVEMMADVMLTKGKFVPPQPYMPLDESIRHMQLIYLRELAERDGSDDEKLEMLRRWLDQAASMLQQAQPNPAGASATVQPNPAVAGGSPAQGGVPGAGTPPAV